MGTKGMCCFMVDRNTPGITVGKVEDKLGIRIPIPPRSSSKMSGSGQKPDRQRRPGLYIIMKTLDISGPVSPPWLPAWPSAVYESLAYSRLRTQFGKPISSFQAIQFKLADMAMRIQASRLLYYEASSLQDMGVPRFSKSASLAKAFAGDTAMFCAIEAVQIFGGYGYTREYPVEKLMRDAKIFQIYEGTGEIQRIVIANDLLRE